MLPAILDVDRLINRFFDYDTNYFYSQDMPVDIIEEKDKLLVNVAVPGFREKDLKVELKDNILTIKGKFERKNQKYKQSEIIKKDFGIAYELDESKFNIEKIKTKLKNGILEIEIPKQEKEIKKEKIKSIPIISEDDD
jgi:HSP20 family protein